jgi:hypothetical protein
MVGWVPLDLALTVNQSAFFGEGVAGRGRHLLTAVETRPLYLALLPVDCDPPNPQGFPSIRTDEPGGWNILLLVSALKAFFIPCNLSAWITIGA